MHGHNVYGHPYFHSFTRFRRGPSRLWWFFLGGAAVAIWNHTHRTDADRRRFTWCGERRIGRGDDDAHAGEGRWGRRGETSTMAVPNSRAELGSHKENAGGEDHREPEPLWKLRSEKEEDRLRVIRDIEVREKLLNAREKVCARAQILHRDHANRRLPCFEGAQRH